MKNLLLGLCLTVASCVGTSTGYERSNIKDAVEIVVERHDAYVASDAALSQDQRDSYFAESDKLIELLGSDPVPAKPMRDALPPVLDRHDAYINADATLTAPQQVQRLRTSTLLRRLIES